MRVTLAEAIDLLRQGQVVAIPTETVYGLAADASNDRALQKIYATKQRPANNPLIVHLADVTEVLEWASEFPPLAQKIAHAFWPGPLTIVLPSKPEVSHIVRAGEPTIALRVPAHPVARQLLTLCGMGLAAPSANLYTHLSPTTADHVESSLGTAIPVLDGGACQVGIESTIVSVSGDQWQLLRPGMIDADAITKIAGKADEKTFQTPPKVPGQHLLHYSPRTPCLLFDSRSALKLEADKHAKAVALFFGSTAAFNLTYSYAIPLQPNLAAEQLYAALHFLDAFDADILLIESPPNGPEWEALHDRLQRAAYHA